MERTRSPSKDYHYLHYEYPIDRRSSPPRVAAKPRREITLEFSPFDDQVDDIREQLVARELINQNGMLKQQLHESSEIIEKLGAELAAR
ncbi:unnamed protein product [Sphagnum balticum]